jgi:hypothetical protein
MTTAPASKNTVMDIIADTASTNFDHRRRRTDTSRSLESAVTAYARVFYAVAGTPAAAPVKAIGDRLGINDPEEKLFAANLSGARLDLRRMMNFFRDHEQHVPSRHILRDMWRRADRAIQRLEQQAAK